MVTVACGCGAGICATTVCAGVGVTMAVCFGTNVEVLNSRDSKDFRFSRFLAWEGGGMAGCGLAVVAVACGCGAGICAETVIIGIGVAMACCGMATACCGIAMAVCCGVGVVAAFCGVAMAGCGVAMAGCDVARDMRFSRFLVGVCAMEDNSLSVVAMASCIIDVNKTTCAVEAEASSGRRQSGIASAEKLCKSMPGMSISK